MRDRKAPGKRPLAYFLISSRPGNRPRPVPRPGTAGVPVAPPGLTLLRRPVCVLSWDKEEGKALTRTPPHPDWRQQSLFTRAGSARTWPCADRRYDVPAFQPCQGPRPSKKKQVGFHSGSILLQRTCVKGMDVPRMWPCELTSFALWAPSTTDRTPPGHRAHPGGYSLMLFLPGPRRLRP